MSVPAVPALRRPKFMMKLQESKLKHLEDVQYVIVTLKDENKLVVSSDAYHGIITEGEMYKCLFCKMEMKLESNCKEQHKNSKRHSLLLQKYPPAVEYAENLIRKLTVDTSFCTICSVSISNVHLMRHLHTEVHTMELQKATLRATSYKPS